MNCPYCNTVIGELDRMCPACGTDLSMATAMTGMPGGTRLQAVAVVPTRKEADEPKESQQSKASDTA